ATEGLLFQSSEIDHRSVTEKSGMPDGGVSGGRGNHRRVANHRANIVNAEAAANETARTRTYILHRGRSVRVITKRCLTRDFRALGSGDEPPAVDRGGNTFFLARKKSQISDPVG